VDDVAGTIDIARERNREAPTPRSLVLNDVISSVELRRSIVRIATSALEAGIDGSGAHRAARDVLLRKPPRLDADAPGPLLREAESPRAAALRLVVKLDASYLAIQGPPGSGKTTLGGEMIAALVASGKRVGVTANSHKVIGQLLEMAAAAARSAGMAMEIGQRPQQDEPCTYRAARSLDSNEEARDALVRGEVNVVGGTAWLWSREEFAQSVDVLFVDEAGQMSLANVLAASPAATSLVLLGDPQQLDQPLQGVHPPGADRSALSHLLGDSQTMPAELGLFLDGTWRLHPDICRFTSEVFYDGRLEAYPGREQQRIIGEGPFAGSGLRFMPVAHQGHQSESPEEALLIQQLVEDLLASNAEWVDGDGAQQALGREDVLVITPYNAQVQAISALLPGVPVGTVDKFQGQQAAIAIYSMATSSAEEAPRGMEFLYSLNRLNVATSRAKCIAMVVASPALVLARCRNPRQMRLANALASFIELSVVPS
jgi:uncharacterized protein